MKKPTYARELTVRYELCSPRVAIDGRAITDAKAAAAILVPLLESSAVERFVVLHLCTKRKLLGIQNVGIGSIAHVDVSVRAIFQACLGERNSQGLILAHNHLSGDCTPSDADIEVTRRVIEVGELLDVECVDHLIVGHGEYISMQESGRMLRR